MLRLVLASAVLALAFPALAAGVDSHAYSCAQLQTIIARNGFVFIGNPDFQDFVVANASFCAGGDVARLRSVATRDLPECPVVYCVPAPENVP